jgi:hypothetical protein
MFNVLDNTVLRKILVSKREEITGGCGQLPNKEHHDLCSSIIYEGDQIKGMRWAEQVMDGKSNPCKAGIFEEIT